MLRIPFINRLRHALQARWYKFVPTDRLIEQIRKSGKGANAQPLLDALRERLAYQDGSLKSVDWARARLDGVALSACALEKANFASASLRGAYFGASDLRQASFTEADLSEANLREARLDGADLTSANLQAANLARADLRGALLVSANLGCANLWGSDLRGANLYQADLTACAAQNIKVDHKTILPDGKACRHAEDLRLFIVGSSGDRAVN